MDIKIESGIPIGSGDFDTGRLSGLTEAIRLMNVGDSFVIPKSKRTSLPQIFNNLGFKVLTRSISADEIRVWRTK